MKKVDVPVQQEQLVLRYRTPLLPYIVVGYDLSLWDGAPEVAGAFPNGEASAAFAKLVNEAQDDEYLVAYTVDGANVMILEDDGTITIV